MLCKELARGASCLVRMEGNQTILRKPDGDESDVKAFTFDKSYWSADKNDPNYADQNRVYNDLGVELLDHAFDGYNCCIFACKITMETSWLAGHRNILNISKMDRRTNRFGKVIFNGKKRRTVHKKISYSLRPETTNRWATARIRVSFHEHALNSLIAYTISPTITRRIEWKSRTLKFTTRKCATC